MTTIISNIRKTRLAVYTVLVGQKESLNDPLQIIKDKSETDLEIDYFCFTDNLQWESNTWQLCNFSHPLIPAEKSSRLPKACPDKYFPDYDYSLYIDNTVVFKRMPMLADINESIFKGFRHPWRTSPVDEADIVVKSGLDEAETVASQMKYYEKQRSISNMQHLTAGTVLLRKHHESKVKKFGALWWEQILMFSKRDQLSLDLCAQEAGCPVEYFDGDKLNNDLFLWPVVPNGQRVLGSFDADYYAWKNRNDAEAISDPKKHFLTYNGDKDKEFNKRVSLFNYACSKTNSSLGKHVSPRRNVADVIEKHLLEEKKPAQILIVGTHSDSDCAVDLQELENAERAFQQYYKFEQVPHIVSAQITENEVNQDAPFLEAKGTRNFDLVVVLGLTKTCVNHGLSKFSQLLSQGGTLIVGFNASLTVQEILSMHGAIRYTGSLNVFHGQHVTQPTVMPSSIFYLKND